jgi:hypothetical protein
VSSNTASDLPASGVSPLSARITLPQHVVYRSFPAETVVLNLETGRYHGLNPCGGRMLEELERSSSVGAAAETLALFFEQPRGTIELDLCELCDALQHRGLIEIDGAREP